MCGELENVEACEEGRGVAYTGADGTSRCRRGATDGIAEVVCELS